MSKLKKFLPVITNSLFLLVTGAITVIYFTNFYLVYTIVVILTEVVFYVFLKLCIPTYKKKMPKLFGDVNVKESSALRNMFIDIGSIVMPGIVYILYNLVK